MRLWPEGPSKHRDKGLAGDSGDFAEAVKTIARGSAPLGVGVA